MIAVHSILLYIAYVLFNELYSLFWVIGKPLVPALNPEFTLKKLGI